MSPSRIGGLILQILGGVSVAWVLGTIGQAVIWGVARVFLRLS